MIVDVKCALGPIAAHLEVEYDVDGDSLVFDSKCVGIAIIEPNCPQISIAFTAKAGPEAALAEKIAEAAEAVWSGRIRDACWRDAEERKITRIKS